LWRRRRQVESERGAVVAELDAGKGHGGAAVSAAVLAGESGAKMKKGERMEEDRRGVRLKGRGAAVRCGHHPPPPVDGGHAAAGP
jgi:hypothetical protein